MRPLQPKIPNWQHMAHTDGSIMPSQRRDAQQSGASFFVPEDINHSKTLTWTKSPNATDGLIQSIEQN
eukprot:1156831-Pelagomonas_calceolata.AAC.8